MRLTPATTRAALDPAAADAWADYRDALAEWARRPTPERADIVEARFRAFHAVYVADAGDPARVDRAARLLRENMAGRRRVALPPGTPDIGGLVHA